MNKVKVLHIITKLELGGAQQNTLYTVKNLDSEKFETHLFSGQGGILDKEAAGLAGRFQHVPALVRKINPVQDLKALFQLKKMIRILKPDVVHTHSSKAGILGRIAARWAKVPVIIHSIHGFGIDAVESDLVRKILVAAEKYASNRTNHFISVSQKNIDEGLAMGLFNKEQVSLIYSGVFLKQYRDAVKKPQLKQELGIPVDAPLVGKIACFKPQKNPLAFVEVASLIATRLPEVHFMLVGDGIMRQEIETAIDAAGLRGKFHLPGWRRDIADIVKLFDVSVLTSRWEGLPRVISESLSAGVPVVVTRAGGSAEAVIEGETGFVVEQGENEYQAERIMEILNHPDLAAKMSEKGPDSVAAWDIDEMVKAQEKLYLKLLDL